MTVARIIVEEPILFEKLPKDIDTLMLKLLEGCLKKNPQERLSIKELLTLVSPKLVSAMDKLRIHD